MRTASKLVALSDWQALCRQTWRHLEKAQAVSSRHDSACALCILSSACHYDGLPIRSKVNLPFPFWIAIHQEAVQHSSNPAAAAGHSCCKFRPKGQEFVLEALLFAKKLCISGGYGPRVLTAGERQASATIHRLFRSSISLISSIEIMMILSVDETG